MVSAGAIPVRRLYGLPIAAATRAQVVSRCEDALAGGRSLHLGVVNAAKIVNARHDAELREALLSCDVIVADGQSVVWAARLLGRPLPERVAGIDLFTALLERAAAAGTGVYLLGATAEVCALLVENLRRDYPGLVIAGARDGYFDEDEAGAVAAAIGASGAGLVFLGMTSPKKERFIAEHGHAFAPAVVHGVGGSFDVLAGVTRRAPLAWQRLGLEWAYRLLQEPGRLWRRYARTNSAFVLLTLRERLRPTPPLTRTSR